MSINNWFSNAIPISPFSTTCTRTNANVGDTITIKTNGTGGLAPYTVFFSQTNGSGNISPPSQSNVGEGVNVTATYVVVAADLGKNITFKSYVVDSCGSGTTSSTVSCVVSIADCSATTSTTISIVAPAIACNSTINPGDVVFRGVNHDGGGTGSWNFELHSTSTGLIRSVTISSNSYNFPPVTLNDPGTYTYYIRSKASCESIWNSSVNCSVTIQSACTIPICNMEVS